jgi:hypothetical protein
VRRTPNSDSRPVLQQEGRGERGEGRAR